MSAAAGLFALAAALIGAVAAIVMANTRERAKRRALLEDCAGLLDKVERAVAPSGHGVMRGGYRGRRAALTPIAEALAFRRLPQLWLSAVVSDCDEGRPTIEIVRRANAAGLFAGGADPLTALRLPVGWPRDTTLRGSRDADALLARLDPLLAQALTDPKLKAVSIGLRGVRVVRQAAQGARSAYLLFRDTRFGETRVAREEARLALELATSIADLVQIQGLLDARHAA